MTQRTLLSLEPDLMLSVPGGRWSSLGRESRNDLLEFTAMRLEGIQTGDIVEVDRKGRRFHAIVTGTAPGGLALQPTDRRVNYYSCRSREVVGHWAKRGRPRETAEPLRPSPRQLEIDLTPRPPEG
jgi:hypothetical protein